MLRRRTFVKLGFIGTAVAAAAIIAGKKFGYLRILSVAALTQDEEQIVTVYVDLLVPADSVSPGAVDLGVDRKILENAVSTKSFRRLIKEGSHWLNDQAVALGTSNFLALDQAYQMQLISRSEGAEFSSIEKRLFLGLRNRTFHHYYAHPESWKGLGISQPPQPAGYPDYAQPPGPRV